MNSFSAKSHLVCVNVVCKLCEKLRCFPGKFTHLEQILHDTAGRDGRDKSQLCTHNETQTYRKTPSAREEKSHRDPALDIFGLTPGDPWLAVELSLAW